MIPFKHIARVTSVVVTVQHKQHLSEQDEGKLAMEGHKKIGLKHSPGKCVGSGLELKSAGRSPGQEQGWLPLH